MDRFAAGVVSLARVISISSVLAFLAGACAQGNDRGPASDEGSFHSVRDSAGIRIAESARPFWGEGEGWTIDPEPLLQIGAIEGDPAYQFSNVWTAAQHPDGRIALVDRSGGTVGEVRVFDSQGRHARTIGRVGQGPGEFSWGPHVTWVPPDTLLTWDPDLRRLTWFGPQGEVLREGSRVALLTAHAIRSSSSPTGWQLLRNGALVSNGSTSQLSPDGAVGRLTQQLHLLPTSGDTLFSLSEKAFPDFHYLQRPTGGGSSVDRAFDRRMIRPATRTEPLTVYVAGDERWEVFGFGPEGSRTEILRAAVPRTPVTSGMVEAEREALRERAARSGESVSALLQIFGRYPVPDSLPAIQALYMDGHGYLWVLRRGRARPAADLPRFDVIDPEGRWLGTVSLPADAGRILEIGHDAVLTAWSDELGVQYLRLYRVRR